jgi:mannan endo-1,4-beta-mannosidase
MKRLSKIFILFCITLGACNCQGQTPLREPLMATLPVENKTVGDPPAEFVSVRDGRFMLNGEEITFVGTNFSQGMNLAATGENGDREQLLRELDALQTLGITNLRIMASSEGPNSEPYRMTPALMTAPGVYDPVVMDGLDFLLAEMDKRDMKAVMVLTNFWYWSGGMAQYVSWSEGSDIPYPGDWQQFMNYSAKFYTCVECQQWYRDHIAMLAEHTNAYSGVFYRDDPVIFSWELANEPRRYPLEWVEDTAAYIHLLDGNHLVATGSEGSPPGEMNSFEKTHAIAGIDYATIHIWPQNWGWYDPQNPLTYDSAEKLTVDYFSEHIEISTKLGKPLVLEEFGLARDWETVGDMFEVKSATTFRDRFFRTMYARVEESIAGGGVVGGDNFWAWSGEALPGDMWVADPPHETPGWYSVYAIDESTLKVIWEHGQAMNK